MDTLDFDMLEPDDDSLVKVNLDKLLVDVSEDTSTDTEGIRVKEGLIVDELLRSETEEGGYLLEPGERKNRYYFSLPFTQTSVLSVSKLEEIFPYVTSSDQKSLVARFL